MQPARSTLTRVLGNFGSADDRRKLDKKLVAMDRDAYDNAMPSQLNELAAESRRFTRGGRAATSPPSGVRSMTRSTLSRMTSHAVMLLRRDVFLRASAVRSLSWLLAERPTHTAMGLMRSLRHIINAYC